MHTDPDYSAAYVVLRTDADDGIEGHGLTFTSGRGTEVCVAAIRALEPFVVGRNLEAIVADMRASGGASSRTASCAGSVRRRCHPPRHRRSRERDLGPVGQDRGKPLWKLLVDLSPEDYRRVRRLPLHHRRAGARRSARSAPRRVARAQLARRRSSPRATPPIRRPPAGSATTTPRSRRSSAKPQWRASPT